MVTEKQEKRFLEQMLDGFWMNDGNPGGILAQAGMIAGPSRTALIAFNE
ncbi:hypothetical protein [Persicobacter diffluens]|uniref:Uncharacterized protein n=1 Tax=Persicobacter diffluens TaxID=981 RepID=A0AAN4VWY9_9BACT|nr:hypothetical protein PEDI_13060 [Persicobacter diffluens]